jgi:hypothetical protein
MARGPFEQTALDLFVWLLRRRLRESLALVGSQALVY